MRDMINNLSKYPRFLVTVSLGIFFYLFEFLKPLSKRPVTAVALLTLVGASFAFIFFTLRAMLVISPA
jgi:hypothetical protein